MTAPVPTTAELTDSEREAIEDAIIDDRSRAEGFVVLGPGGTAGSTPTVYEATERILTARLSALRAEIADQIETKAARLHADFAADEDAALESMRDRLGVKPKPNHWNRHDDGCHMCGLADAARVARGGER